MLALSDNDIICKLVVGSIFDDALTLMGCTRDDVRILPSSRWTIGHRKPTNRHRRSVVEKYGEAAAAEIGDLLESLTVAREPSAATDGLLVAVEIDPGEKHLLRLAYEYTETVVATSDKRALLSLLQDAESRGVCERIAGRVVVFETVLLGLIETHGVTWLAQRLGGAIPTDGLLRLAFSNGEATPENHVVECLHSYSREVAPLLRKLTTRRAPAIGSQTDESL